MNNSTLNDVSALLTLFEQSVWSELHLRSDNFEIYISSNSSGVNPMGDTTHGEDDAVITTRIETITAPHLGTFVPSTEQGACLDIGDELGVVQVLDEPRPLRSPVAGIVETILSPENSLVEYGSSLFEIRIVE